VKKKLTGIIFGAALLIVVAVSRIGPDVTPVVSKGAKSPPVSSAIENPSSLSVKDLESLVLPLEMALDAQAAINTGESLFDLPGLVKAMKEENHREAIEKWYQESLKKAEENNNYRSRDFLKSPVTKVRIQVALDLVTYSKELFVPAYESGAEIDLDSTLLPIINSLSDTDIAATYKYYQDALDIRKSTLHKAAKYYADEDGSPSIEKKHMERAKQAFKNAMAEMDNQ